MRRWAPGTGTANPRDRDRKPQPYPCREPPEPLAQSSTEEVFRRPFVPPSLAIYGMSNPLFCATLGRPETGTGPCHQTLARAETRRLVHESDHRPAHSAAELCP